MNKCNKSSRVQSNLLQQNCFVRDVTRIVDLKTDCSDCKFYESLDEVCDDTGIKIVKNPVPYPITPDYVSSFADSTDYKRDPAGAIANGVSKRNLGDCTDFQNIMSMDSSAQLALFRQLQDKFGKCSIVSDNSNNSTGNSTVNNNLEVNNNG